MAKDKEDIYLFNFSEQELMEIFEGLVLRDELQRRTANQNDESEPTESELLKKVGNQFAHRTSHHMREYIIDVLDEYLDDQIDDELLWQKIEEELKKRLRE